MILILQIPQMAGATIWSTLRRGIRLKETLRLLDELGIGSLLFIVVTLAFVGILGTYQVAKQMERLIPEYSLMGAGVIQLLTREFAPVMAALMVATKVGTGLAAETGTMQVTDQIDAMRLCGADPISEVVVPRVWATTIATFCLAAIGGLVALLAGMAVSWFGFQVPAETFLSLRFVNMSDLIVGCVKAGVFGFAIPVVSLTCGFRATGGSGGVGEATTRAVVYSCFAVILLDLIVGAIAELL